MAESRHNQAMKKVLITGVSGQDGSLMADYLLENTDFLIYGGFRHTSNPSNENCAHLFSNPRFFPVEIDITDYVSVERAVRGVNPDYFINFAANSFVGNSWNMPINHFETNAMGVLNCLEALRLNKFDCRFYNAGSSEQFGNVEYSPQDEKHPFKPRSPYGASKCAAHHITKVYRESYKMYAVQGLLFNHEGVRRGKSFVTRKISMAVARIKNSIDNGDFDFAPLELGNLDSKRDWSDAEDFCDGVWKMLNNNNPIDYVLSSNETNSVRVFVEWAFKAVDIHGKWFNIGENPVNEEFLKIDNTTGLATKKKITLVKINPEFYRPAEVDLLLGDSTLAREQLGWKPKVSFEELVSKMVLNDYAQIKNT